MNRLLIVVSTILILLSSFNVAAAPTPAPGAPTVTGISPTLGPTGQWVYVFGSNFVGGQTTVSMGGKSLIGVNVYGPDQLGFTVPDTATGASNITVTTPNGSATSTQVFTVKVLHLLSINGQASVNKSSTNYYTATATWNDKSTSSVSPTWSVSPITYSSINAYGVLNTLDVPSNLTVTINGSYTNNGITKTADRTVTILEKPDTTAPTLLLSILTDGSVTKNATLIINGIVTDNESGVQSVAVNGQLVTIDEGGNFTTYMTLLPDNNTIMVIATDNADNQKTETRTVALDTTPPTVSLTTPIDGSYTGTANFIVTGSVSDSSGIKSLTINGAVVTLNGDGSFRTVAVLMDGGNTVTVIATDNANNQKTVIRTVLFDTSLPTLILSTLPNGAYTNNATQNITGTVLDSNSGIKSLTVNGASVPVATNDTFSLALTLVAGANTITTIATDNVNNQTTDIRTITLDQAAPILSVAAPPDNSAVAVSTFTVSGSVNKSASVSMKLNNDASQTVPVDGNTFTTSTMLAVGLNTIDLTATDLAGNTSSAKRSVIYDNTKPTLAVTVPNQDINTNQSTLNLQGTVSDALSVTTVSITMDGLTFTPVVTNGAFQQLLTFTILKQYAIVVAATDQAGNSSTVQRNVIFEGMSGDVNGDKTVNVFDALLTLQYAVGLVEHNTDNNLKYKSFADVAPLENGKPKGDGMVNVFDALAILRHAVGLDLW